jgi:rubrerythrin
MRGRGVFSSMSSSSPMTEDNSLKYYCMSCGTQHKEISCPNCGSKMKKVGYG